MTAFWVGAAGLVLLAWLIVLPAWRSRGAQAAAAPSQHLVILQEQLAALDADLAAGTIDAEQHALARQEVQRRMLDETGPETAPVRSASSRKTGVVVAAVIPLFAVGVYMGIGNLPGIQVQGSAQAREGPEVSPEEVEAMLTKLSQRLEKSTGNAAADLQGWTMLGRSYAVLQRFAEADRAYVRAIALAPNDAQLLADRADVLAMLQNQSMKGEPERLTEKALQIDPNNMKALALAGSGAYERKDFAAARGYWQKARALAPDGSEFAVGLDSSLDAVRGASGGASAPASTATATAAAANAPPARISGRVSLAPALAARVAPGDTVFIFARAAEGPRMPLAILRRTVAELPISFTLDDSMAMSPQMKLSNFPRVVIGARISRSGNAMPQSGDLRGESAPTATQAADLQLVIDGVQP